MASMSSGSGGSGSLLPPNAKAGECYARIFIPPAYETTNKSVLATEASESIRVTEPTYETVRERVLVNDASERLEVVPAQYETVSEQLLVRPASTTRKKGRGPIEKVDNMTGEIICLVETPAEYRTVTTKKLVSGPTTRAIAIPATYTTIKKRVLVEDAKTVEVEIPAVYDTTAFVSLYALGSTGFMLLFLLITAGFMRRA